MPFKIVQTIEKGNIVLSCVPHQWESDGVLYWPRKQQQPYKLQKDEDSQPDQTWHQFNCAVKRQNIKTYQDARHEIDLMSNNSDTEPDVRDVSAKKQSKCYDIPLSYNIIAEECLKSKNASSKSTMPGNSDAEHNMKIVVNTEDADQTTNYTNQLFGITAAQVTVASDEIPTPAAAIPSENLLIASHDNIDEFLVIPENNQLKSLETDIDTIKSDIKSIKDDVRAMMETLNTTLNNQGIIHDTLKPILIKVSELQVMNEEFIKKSIIDKRNDSLGLQPIKDLKDLEDFEKKLMDSEYREDLRRKLSVLCTKGDGQGTTIAYAIVDVLFERQFFKSCSWTGASRSQSEPTEKICFKGFSKTITFFFDTIHKLDSTFHLIDCHRFFKTVLRNADQRAKIEPKRASTKKCRGKNSDKKTCSKNRVTKETTLKHPPIEEDKETCCNQKEVEDVSEETLDLK